MFGGSAIDRETDANRRVVATGFEEDWKVLHRRLRAIANQRVALEADELRCLAMAEEAGLHRRLGYSTILEYMERELHWGPHAARERLRVARELLELPMIAEALRSGDVCFAAVRELTRVATRETEEAFLENALGKTARQVEQMVAGLDNPMGWCSSGIAMKTLESSCRRVPHGTWVRIARARRRVPHGTRARVSRKRN